MIVLINGYLKTDLVVSILTVAYHHGEKGDWGKHTLWERTSNVPFIRNQHRRYGKWPNGEELFDLKTDPHECHNLANNPDNRARLQVLRAVLIARQQIAQNARSMK